MYPSNKHTLHSTPSSLWQKPPELTLQLASQKKEGLSVMWLQELTHILQQHLNIPVHGHTRIKSQAHCATLSTLRNSAHNHNPLSFKVLWLFSMFHLFVLLRDHPAREGGQRKCSDRSSHSCCLMQYFHLLKHRPYLYIYAFLLVAPLAVYLVKFKSTPRTLLFQLCHSCYVVSWKDAMIRP